MSWIPKASFSFAGTQYTALPDYDAAFAQDTTPGTWRLSTNGTSAGCTVAGSARCWITGAAAPGPDQAIRYTINGSSLQLQEGCAVRFTNGDLNDFWGGTGYVSFFSTTATIDSYRLDGGGSHTLLAQTAFTPTTGDRLSGEAVGSDITVLVNGSQIHLFTDATYSDGDVALWSGSSLDDSTNLSIDDLVIEEWSSVRRFLLVR
jgi:hypothetical protein